VFALLLAAAVSIVSVGLGIVAVVLSAGAIYFRGYLVPGTPQLTKRYLPDRVLGWFDKHPLAADREDGESFETVAKIEHQRANAVDPEAFLLDVGAVEDCADGTDLCLTDEFAAAIDRQLETDSERGVDPAAIADLFDVAPDDVSARDRPYPAYDIGRRRRKWPGEGSLQVDLATHEALTERTDRWDDVPVEQRRGILESLRSFHETCPACGGSIGVSSNTVESCCRSYDVLTIGCEGCGERFLELDPSTINSRATDKEIIP
ncbi:MAG: hypothetical protein ACQETB_11705, partial [Halobacteriota archaeon]